MPSYLKGYSDSITQPKGDSSTGVALSTLGTGIEGAASLAETTAKDIINKDVRSTVEPIRQDFTSSLEAANAARKNSVVPAAVQTSEGASVNVMDANASADSKPVPIAIDNGLGRVEAIQSAMANGKVNDTYYDLRLKNAVTDLRSKYPGFVDYIDSRVSAITGINPANAYVQNLMQDLNAKVSQKKTEADKVLDLARNAMTKGFDKANLMYERLQKDPSFEPQFNQWYTEENAKFTRLQFEDLQRNNYKGNKDTLAADRKGQFTNYVGDVISSDFNAVLRLSGMSEASSAADILKQAGENPGKFNEQQMEEFATRIQTQRNILRTQIVSLSNKKGYTQDIGTNDRDSILDSQLKVYDDIYDAVRKGGSGGAGLAFFHMNQTRAIFDQTKNNLTNGELGPYLNNYKIVSDALGPSLSSILIPTLINERVPDKLRPLFIQQALEGRAQPEGPGNPTSITTHLEDLDRLAKGKKITPAEKAQQAKSLINTVEDLKNPELMSKNGPNIVQYMFNPRSNSILQNFNMDYTTTSPDGRLKVEHPGKYAVWTQMTDKDITKNINTLDSTSKQMYKNWVNITGRELIGEDVKSLNHFTGHDNLYFDWNGKDKKLVLKDKEGALAPIVGTTTTNRPPPDSYIWQVQKVVDRINSALPNLDNVYSTLGGGDTETMLLQTLQQYGMNFEGKISGLPKAFGDAVAASRKPLKPEVK